MKKILIVFGLYLIIIGLSSIVNNNSEEPKVLYTNILICALGSLMIFYVVKKIINELRLEKIKNEKSNIEYRKKVEDDKANINKIIEDEFAKVDKLITQIASVKKIQVIDISNYKKLIEKNEEVIIIKGGDPQLLSFMKIDSFLQDFRNRIVEDQLGLSNRLSVDSLKNRIQEQFKKNGRLSYEYQRSARKSFELGNVMYSSLENQIITMNYYRNMAVAMILFYTNDKKIRYFEIYEAFEKLGVFDSSWQKNVFNKLDDIETRLAQIDNQLTSINQNFASLIESNETIITALKSINSSLITNNFLQAITAYQSYRLNKNIKFIQNK